MAKKKKQNKAIIGIIIIALLLFFLFRNNDSTEQLPPDDGSGKASGLEVSLYDSDGQLIAKMNNARQVLDSKKQAAIWTIEDGERVPTYLDVAYISFVAIVAPYQGVKLRNFYIDEYNIDYKDMAMAQYFLFGGSSFMPQTFSELGWPGDSHTAYGLWQTAFDECNEGCTDCTYKGVSTGDYGMDICDLSSQTCVYNIYEDKSNCLIDISQYEGDDPFVENDVEFCLTVNGEVKIGDEPYQLGIPKTECAVLDIRPDPDGSGYSLSIDWS